jgi:hypothetical protein
MSRHHDMLQLLLLLFLASNAQAQYIQRWDWRVAPPTNGGAWISKPYWRKDANDVRREVLFTNANVVLE